MKSKADRLKRLESQASEKPVFIDWQGGRQWTEEEKAEAIRLHPEVRCFWMPLSKAFGFGTESQET